MQKTYRVRKRKVERELSSLVQDHRQLSPSHSPEMLRHTIGHCSYLTIAFQQLGHCELLQAANGRCWMSDA